MGKFVVRWEVDVEDVENPLEAAEAAKKMQQDPEAICHVFDVFRSDSKHGVRVDLDSEKDKLVGRVQR